MLEVGELGADRELGGAPQDLVDVLVDDLDDRAGDLVGRGVGGDQREGGLHLREAVTAVGDVVVEDSESVGDDRAVAGTLVPGQLVDLIVTMAINPEIGQTPQQAQRTQSEIIPGPSTKVTLQSLTILARNGGLYILRTDLATAEKVAELTAAGGQFTFVLRADVDDRVASTDGSTSTPDPASRAAPASSGVPRLVSQGVWNTPPPGPR